MDIVKSKDNNKIKYIKNLYAKKFRDEENAYIIEGIKFVNEAIKEKADIKYILLSEKTVDNNEIKEITKYADKNIIYICTDNVFESTADTVNSQGILAVVNKKINIKTLDDYNFIIMCDRIQDPGNLGTIIRTADVFGPALIILNKGCVDVYNPKVVRASAGAILRTPFIFNDIDTEIIGLLKNSGFRIISTIVNSLYSFEDIQDTEKICIVIGNEGSGISQEIIENSDISITIRMSGRAESLNASIAAGICIYEISKKLHM